MKTNSKKVVNLTSGGVPPQSLQGSKTGHTNNANMRSTMGPVKPVMSIGSPRAQNNQSMNLVSPTSDVSDHRLIFHSL